MSNKFQGPGRGSVPRGHERPMSTPEQLKEWYLKQSPTYKDAQRYKNLDNKLFGLLPGGVKPFRNVRLKKKILDNKIADLWGIPTDTIIGPKGNIYKMNKDK